MVQFFPNTSKIFQVAAFKLFYSSLPIVAIRLIVGLILFLLFILAASSGSNKILSLSYSFLVTLLILEVFYRFKISREKPEKDLSRISSGDNIADFLTLEAAQTLLKVPDLTNTNQIFLKLIGDPCINFVLTRSDISTEDINKILAGPAEKIPIEALFSESIAYSKKESQEYIDQFDILLALFKLNKGLANLEFQKELKENDLLNIVFWARRVYSDTIPFWEKPADQLGPGIFDTLATGWTLETEKYTRDLTRELTKGGLRSALVGRESTIDRIQKTLSRSGRKNVVLIGEPGIGKTTIVLGLASKSQTGNLVAPLNYKRFLQLDLTALLAEAQTGELERRLRDLITEVKHSGNVILFIPNIELISGSKESRELDITGFFLQTLRDPDVAIIGTSTRDNWRRYVETKSGFAELFDVAEIKPPTSNEAIRILEDAAASIEPKHHVVITYKAINQTVELSERYVIDRALPGKAIDLLEEAATSVALNKKYFVESLDIQALITEETKIPVGTPTGTESEKLLNLEQELHKRIIDQEEAIKAVSESIRRARTITRTTNRPIGVFLFLGPTGVGKTETAKALAATYFGSENRMIRFDMNEFQDINSVTRLIGSPPGSSEYEAGGQLTEAVRKDPFTLVLLDEIEKAHRKVLELFLNIFDEGRIADASGRQISFTNTLIVATSNAGAEYIREAVGINEDISALKTNLLEKLQREGIFSPEFLNRFDSIVVYKPLTLDQVQQVTQLLLMDLAARIKKQDISLVVTPKAVKWLSNKGYNPTYGARPLRRLIADSVEDALAKKLLSKEVVRGSTVTIDIDSTDNLVFT